MLKRYLLCLTGTTKMATASCPRRSSRRWWWGRRKARARTRRKRIPSWEQHHTWQICAKCLVGARCFQPSVTFNCFPWILLSLILIIEAGYNLKIFHVSLTFMFKSKSSFWQDKASKNVASLQSLPSNTVVPYTLRIHIFYCSLCSTILEYVPTIYRDHLQWSQILCVWK